MVSAGDWLHSTLTRMLRRTDCITVGLYLRQSETAFCSLKPASHWPRGAPERCRGFPLVGGVWQAFVSQARLSLAEVCPGSNPRTSSSPGSRSCCLAKSFLQRRKTSELFNQHHGGLMEHQHLLRNYISDYKFF